MPRTVDVFDGDVLHRQGLGTSMACAAENNAPTLTRSAWTLFQIVQGGSIQEVAHRRIVIGRIWSAGDRRGTVGIEGLPQSDRDTPQSQFPRMVMNASFFPSGRSDSTPFGFI